MASAFQSGTILLIWISFCRHTRGSLLATVKYLSVFQKGDMCMSDNHGNGLESQTPSFPEDNGSSDASKADLEIRRRGRYLTSWLVFMSLIYGLLVVAFAIIYLSGSAAFAPTPITTVLNILALVFTVLGSVGVVGMWLWRKWGYYLLVGSYIVAFLSGLAGLLLDPLFVYVSLAVDIVQLIYAVLAGAFLYAMMSKKFDSFD